MYNRRKYLDRKSHIAWKIISILNYLVMLGVVGEKLDYLVPNDYERSLVNFSHIKHGVCRFSVINQAFNLFYSAFFCYSNLKVAW